MAESTSANVGSFVILKPVVSVFFAGFAMTLSRIDTESILIACAEATNTSRKTTAIERISSLTLKLGKLLQSLRSLLGRLLVMPLRQQYSGQALQSRRLRHKWYLQLQNHSY